MEARCPICQEEYDSDQKTPRIVPECGHTFCEACIAQGNKKFFVCPLNNETHHFQNDKIDMPRNLTLLRAIKNKISLKIPHTPPTAITKQKSQIQQYKVKLNDVTLESNIKLESEIVSLNKEIVSKSKIVEQTIQDINRYLVSKVNDKFKIYYQTIKKYQDQFLSQINELKSHYRSVFAAYQTQINNHIFKSHDILNTNDSEKIKYLTKQIQNTAAMLTRKMGLIKQNINKKFEMIQLVQIKSSSTFITHLLSQDIQLKNNRTNSTKSNNHNNTSLNNITVGNNRSQINLHTPTRISQNDYLSVYSKPSSPQKSQFKIFVQRKNEKDSQITTNGKFSPNLRKPMKLISQANKQSAIFAAHQYYDMANPLPIPRKKSMNSSRSLSTQRNKLENRRKLDDILEIISDTRSPNLQLYNMSIKDSYMKSIGQCISKSNKKIGLLKLVKNQITDRGLQLLLVQLCDYQYMHTLNLTSNYLTDSSLDVILQFSKHNTVLTNFYVSHNNFSVPKGYRKLLNESGINVFF